MGLSTPGVLQLTVAPPWGFPATLYSHVNITSVSTLVGCDQFQTNSKQFSLVYCA